ncbi:MAG: DUF1735 domain-containing protein [Arcicella sp.]|nr:DUF1735 domain-containing protein [Arcicella sp.]
MKRITLKIALFGVLITGLYACSTDSENNPLASDATVSMAGTDAGTLVLKTYKLDVARIDSFTVSITSADLLKTDLPITLDISQAGLDLQNTKRKALGEVNYTVLPVNTYTISPNPVIIKAGTRTAKFFVKVNIPASIDFSNDYLLPVGISKAGEAKINSTLSFVNIAVEGLPNAYDGIYRSTGSFIILGSLRAINRDKILKTIDKTTSETEFADSSFPMWLKVNKDNSVTIIPKEAAAAFPGPFEQTGINKYDPLTKTFTLNYQYNVGSRVISEMIKKK